jgi:hypothetical protein
VKSKRLIIGAAVAVVVSGVGLYVWDALGEQDEGPGTDILGGRTTSSDGPSFLDLTGPPIFSFGSLYLEGRSSWCLQQFQADRADVGSVTLGDKLDVTTTIIREPFTDGKWLAELSDDEMRLREETESQAVTVEATFRVKGVGAVELLVFILCSQYQLDLPVDEASKFDCLFPGEANADDCLDVIPEFGSNRTMTREHWPGGFQKKASDVWFLNEVGRDGDTYFYVYEAWKNCPHDGNYVNIKMSTGQYAISERDGECIVRVRTYYSGQGVPNLPFVGSIVSSRTTKFYAGVADTIEEQAPSWQPYERAKRWKAGLKF